MRAELHATLPEPIQVGHVTSEKVIGSIDACRKELGKVGEVSANERLRRPRGQEAKPYRGYSHLVHKDERNVSGCAGTAGRADHE